MPSRATKTVRTDGQKDVGTAQCLPPKAELGNTYHQPRTKKHLTREAGPAQGALRGTTPAADATRGRNLGRAGVEGRRSRVARLMALTSVSRSASPAFGR